MSHLLSLRHYRDEVIAHSHEHAQVVINLSGSLDVEVRDGVARLTEGGAIAGSTLTMAQAVQYAVAVGGLPLADVVRAATATPAATLGLDRVGALAPGNYADLVVLDASLGVQRVMRHGTWVR